MCVSLAFAVYYVYIFCYPALTAARNNFERAVSTVSLKLIPSNSATCGSVIGYELYGGFRFLFFYDYRRQQNIHVYTYVEVLSSS